MRILTLALALCAMPLFADDTTTKVTGTVTIPQDLADFRKRTLEIRLYEYDPRLADKAADLVEKVEVKDFAHTKGTATKHDFTIGAKGKLNPQRAYYLTIFVLDGDTRTHIGECDHAKNNLGKVLTNGQPNKVTITVRAVR